MPKASPKAPSVGAWLGLVLLSGGALALPACNWDGNFTVLGYSTRPNYDLGIHTVRVPIFKNRTFRKGLEFELTRAVIREIEQKTPYKVVSEGCPADTELTGTIVSFTKVVINVNPLNEVREAETTLGVEVVWKDLRTGEYLTRPGRRPGEPIPVEPPAGPLVPDPLRPPISPPTAPLAVEQGVPGSPPPPPLPGAPPPPPVLLKAQGNFVPELGESIATAMQKDVNRMAVQIVSMMEKPW